ncbi:hypothetical protein A2U01_0101967, partial [Trifolium medium]|nr:hypothetical protein [Trifolium medium]
LSSGTATPVSPLVCTALARTPPFLPLLSTAPPRCHPLPRDLSPHHSG